MAEAAPDVTGTAAAEPETLGLALALATAAELTRLVLGAATLDAGAGGAAVLAEGAVETVAPQAANPNPRKVPRMGLERVDRNIANTSICQDAELSKVSRSLPLARC